MAEVTKEDLDRIVKDIKEHIDERLLPMQEEIDEHELILRGKSKMNGLIGEVRDINTGGRLIKWVAGTGALKGIGAWIARIWKDVNH